MAEVSRKTKLALVEETTKGTPVAPSANSDFVSAQDDLTLEGAFATLENAELTGSIGAAAPVLGVEEPTGSFSHYLRHSGTEGAAPTALNVAIKGAFGSETVNGTEYDTVAGSTTTACEVDSGEGVNFEVGQALLIKDGTNGHSIRNVSSISTDTLNLAYALGGAPASGVNLGKAILYKPAAQDSDYAGISVWGYMGDGGAVQLVAGSRVTEFSAAFAAGEFINSSSSMSGLSFYFDPIEITSANKYIDITDDGGTIAVTLTEGMYKDPHELADHISAAATAASVGSGDDTITCTYSDSTGKFTLASDGSTFSLLWKTGTHGADNSDDHVGTTLGFSDTADDTGSTSYVADSAQDWSTSYAAVSVDPLVAKSNEIFIGDSAQSACTDSVASVTFTLSNELSDVLDVCSTSGKSDNIFNSRTVTVEVDALLERHDADNWKRFRSGQTTSFAYNFGSKSGGNWEAGKSGNIYIPTAKISAFTLADRDGLISVNMTLTAFVDSGANEVFLNFL